MAHGLGQKKEDRSRPIKIVMAAKKHKADFMTKLLETLAKLIKSSNYRRLYARAKSLLRNLWKSL